MAGDWGRGEWRVVFARKRWRSGSTRAVEKEGRDWAAAHLWWWVPHTPVVYGESAYWLDGKGVAAIRSCTIRTLRAGASGNATPAFFVSVAFKGFSDFVSCLESTVAEGPASVADKGEDRKEREEFCDGGGRNELYLIFTHNYMMHLPTCQDKS
jgi:hypothetical protein